MKTAIKIVIALAIMAAIGAVIARVMQGGVEIAEPIASTREPDDTEAVAEQLAEASG